MAQYNASDLRKGLKVEIDGAPYDITEFNFVKPGKGQALYNCKLKNMLNGSTLARTFRSNDKLDKPMLSQSQLTYSYADGDDYIFMNENYEQIPVSADVLGQSRLFLAENMEVEVLFYNNSPVEVTLPTFIEKEVVETEPGARGNTATNVLKPAMLEGGYEISVPLFVNIGDIIKVDTRSGEYSDRVRK